MFGAFGAIQNVIQNTINNILKIELNNLRIAE
jgi:hypothetical protein